MAVVASVKRARIGADVEEFIGLAREGGDGIERQAVVRLRSPTASPEELFRVLASSRVEHHERRARDPALDLTQVRRRRQASRPERGNEARDEPKERVREAEAEETLDVALQAEPALAATPDIHPPILPPVGGRQADTGQSRLYVVMRAITGSMP
jgi:hypothetical protein